MTNRAAVAVVVATLDSSGNPLARGRFVITRVTTRQSSGKVDLTVDKARASSRVKISPPAR